MKTSKTKLLLDVVEGIKALGESLQALAELFRTNETVVVSGEPKQSEELPFDDSEITKQK